MHNLIFFVMTYINHIIQFLTYIMENKFHVK